MGRRSTIPTKDAEAASRTVSEKHQSWPMVKPVLLAALVCAAPVCLSSAQDAKVSVDMMGIGGMSCAHWQSTQALRLEGTIWI
jgi:redox-regulated HSP33 family molecular chaperone